MASGLPWKEYIGVAIACPNEWAFGTELVIDGRTWVCMDRGSAIRFVDGVAWIDMLVADPLYPFGTIVEAEIHERD